MTTNNSASVTCVADIFALVKNNDIKFIDFRFTDYNGKWLHISHCADSIGEEELTKGVSFDGSSVPAWKAINESDMILMPEISTAFIDPFSSYPTLVLTCDVIEPTTGKGYERDPRHTAKLAEKYLQSTKIGDVAYFGPEPEFFVFDNVQFETKPNGCSYEIDSEEGPYNTGTQYDNGNLGNRSPVKGAYFDLAPLDSEADMRSEMIETLREVGITPLLHHHEVANSQHELGFQYSTLTNTADNVQKFKYVIRNICNSYGKTATFMPKPIHGDNGSGMHVHQSIWKDGKPLFLGNGEAGLSDIALYYIGGIIKHAKAINAFANPSTNSYKRLIPGFEAPVLLAYSSKNRSASIRIPHVTNEKARRIEVRFPDPVANSYLAFSAMLMAGLDGIINKIDPGKADNRDLYELTGKELNKIPTVARNLTEALEALDKDREFLKKGGVFTDEQIDAFIKIKTAEVDKYEQVPHPIEFDMYYNS
ncbi:MAG: glutamine synthetase [Myxococcota bacterium]|jgi:glutamine synthetase